MTYGLGSANRFSGIFFTSAHGLGVNFNLQPATKMLNISACETGFYERTAPYEIHVPTRRVINTKRRKQTLTCS